MLYKINGNCVDTNKVNSEFHLIPISFYATQLFAPDSKGDATGHILQLHFLETQIQIQNTNTNTNTMKM